jgi:phytoene synthase
MPYYAATYALPKVKRHHAQALYGFCRHAADVVSAVPRSSLSGREQAINELADQLFGDLAAGSSDDLVLKAVVHTARSFDLDPDCFRRFLRANEQQPHGHELRHVRRPPRLHGRIGGGDRRGMLLPILEPSPTPRCRMPVTSRSRAGSPSAGATSPAISSGGRVYIPQSDLRRFGADPWMRRVTPECAR